MFGVRMARSPDVKRKSREMRQRKRSRTQNKENTKTIYGQHMTTQPQPALSLQIFHRLALLHHWEHSTLLHLIPGRIRLDKGISDASCTTTGLKKHDCSLQVWHHDFQHLPAQQGVRQTLGQLGHSCAYEGQHFVINSRRWKHPCKFGHLAK